MLEKKRTPRKNAKTILLPGHAFGVGKCDFNSDGITDYAVCHSDSSLSIVLGGSTWSVTTHPISGGVPVDAYDLAELTPGANGILVVTDDEAQVLKVTPGTPNPVITDITDEFSNLAAGNRVICLSFFDFEQDGMRDVLMIRESDTDPDTVVVADLYVQDLSGNLSSLSTTTLSLPVHWFRATDTNNDGFADLVTANWIDSSTDPYSFERALGGAGGFGGLNPISDSDGYLFTMLTTAGSPAGVANVFGCISDLINCGGWTGYAPITATGTSAANKKICDIIDLIRDFGIQLTGEGNPCASTVRDIGTALLDAKFPSRFGVADFKGDTAGWVNPITERITIDINVVTAAIDKNCDPTSEEFWDLVALLIHEGAHLKDGLGTSETQATNDTIKVLMVMIEDIEKLCDGDPSTFSWLGPKLGITWGLGGNVTIVLDRIRKEKWEEKWYQIRKRGNMWVTLARAACRDKKEGTTNRTQRVQNRITTKFPGVTFPSNPTATQLANFCTVTITFRFCEYTGTIKKTIKFRPC